jgi:hypothetical protein
MWRGSQYWLAGAAAAVGAYVAFSGHYIDLSVVEVDEDEGDDGEEEMQRHLEEQEEEEEDAAGDE